METKIATFASKEGRDFLINVLQTTDLVEVTFTKSDGSERVMQCTLKESLVVPYENKTDRVRAENTDVLRVWDLEKSAWRGFRLDSIKNVNFNL